MINDMTIDHKGGCCDGKVGFLYIRWAGKAHDIWPVT